MESRRGLLLTHTLPHTLAYPGLCNQTLQRKPQIMDSHNEKWSQMTLTGNVFLVFPEHSEPLPLATKHTAPPLQTPVQVQHLEVQIFIILGGFSCIKCDKVSGVLEFTRLRHLNRYKRRPKLHPATLIHLAPPLRSYN